MGNAYCIGNLHGCGRTWWDAHNEMKKCFFPLISLLLPGEQIRALPGLWAEKGCSTGLFTGMVPVPHPSTKSVNGNPVQDWLCFSTAWSSKYQQGHVIFSRVLSHRGMGMGRSSHSRGWLLMGHASGCSWEWTFYREMLLSLSSALSPVTHRQAFEHVASNFSFLWNLAGWEPIPSVHGEKEFGYRSPSLRGSFCLF